VFIKVDLVSVRVRRNRLIDGTCSGSSGLRRYVFGEVVLVSGIVRRCRLIVATFRQGLVIVGTCSARSN